MKIPNITVLMIAICAMGSVNALIQREGAWIKSMLALDPDLSGRIKALRIPKKSKVEKVEEKERLEKEKEVNEEVNKEENKEENKEVNEVGEEEEKEEEKEEGKEKGKEEEEKKEKGKGRKEQ